MEKELRLHRCCFTGHRPEKIGDSELHIKEKLEFEIKKAIGTGYRTFISGMARGVDIWAAEIVINLRDSGVPIKLICASPYEGFEDRWNPQWKSRYSKIIKSADLVKYINKHYTASCFQIRNQWMVDHSALVIAVHNGLPSGTKNTIDYAYRNNVSVKVIACNAYK